MTPLSKDVLLTALQQGEMTVQGEFVWGSNYTFLAQVVYQGESFQAVYKPKRGERPLWDFPSRSLAHREATAYLVSEALGWELVPPTVYRRQAPVGAGSLQFFIEHDPEYHYFSFSADDRQRLRPAALFDLVVNNADRKGGHILFDPGRHIWLIDHGLCFHEEDKLRTVIWDFAGEPIPAELCTALTVFRQKLEPDTELAASLSTHLNPQEIAALAARTEAILTLGIFPSPDPSRRAIPWPPV